MSKSDQYFKFLSASTKKKENWLLTELNWEKENTESFKNKSAIKAESDSKPISASNIFD